MTEKQRAKKILDILREHHEKVDSFLDHKNPFELLIAVILSAQCTDARVNMVTPVLFSKYKTPQDIVNAPTEEVEEIIKTTGFFKVKTKSIKNCSQALIDNYKGKVPKDFDALNSLPGVGRKTASVVISQAFGVPAIAVDTHVTRLSNILGFVDTKDAEKIEYKLKEIYLEEDWMDVSLFFILHGRNICVARRPKCEICLVTELCPYYKTVVEPLLKETQTKVKKNERKK